MTKILKSNMIPVILLIVICFLIYRNVFNFAFLSYDDDQNILNNKAILNLDFYKIWTEAYYGMYIPITYSVWSVLSSLTSSPNAGLFHGLNLALHLMNGVLVFYLLREIQGLFLNAITGESQVYSFIGAVFFIGHPLQVETVAWVSCTRDLLSSTFALGTLLAFLNGKKVASLVLANIFYIFSLLCKPLSTPLALFLFLFELIILKKRFYATLKKTSSFMLFSLVATFITMSIQGEDIIKKNVQFSIFDAFNNLFNNLFFYISKIVVPVNLSANYQGIFDDLNSVNFFIIKIFIALILVSIFYIIWNKFKPIDRFAALFFGTSILPVLGLIPFSFQSVSPVADRYAYFPLFAVSVLVISFASKVKLKAVSFFTFFILSIILSIASADRVEVWYDDRSLFDSILEKDTDNYLALTHLGLLNLRAKNYSESRKFYEKAIAVNALEANSIANYLLILAHTNEHSQVVKIGEDVLKNPEFTGRNYGTEEMSLLYSTLAYSQVRLGDLGHGLSNFCNALKNNPNNFDALNNLKRLKNSFAVEYKAVFGTSDCSKN